MQKPAGAVTSGLRQQRLFVAERPMDGGLGSTRHFDPIVEIGAAIAAARKQVEAASRIARSRSRLIASSSALGGRPGRPRASGSGSVQTTAEHSVEIDKIDLFRETGADQRLPG